MKFRFLSFLCVVAPVVLAIFFFSALNAQAAPTACPVANGCTGTSTTPAYGSILIGGKNGEYEYVASSTFSGFSPVQSVFGRTGAITAQTGDYTTSQVTEGSNLYFTNARAISALTGQNVSIFNNDAGYLTSLTGAASSTLLSDNNTFSGSNAFTQTLNLVPALNEGIYLQDNSLGTAVASTSGIYLQNTTAAALNSQQVSPFLTLESQGWGTTAGTSQPVDWAEYELPLQGTVPSSNLLWASSVASAAFATRMTLTSNGTLEPINLEAITALGTSNSTNGSIWAPNSLLITHEALPQWAFATSSSNAVGIRTGFYGSTGTVLTVGDNYAAVDMGGTPVTPAASGVHNWLTTLALKPVFALTGSAKIGNTATLYIDGAATTTVNGLNYDLYASSTAPSYFGGKLGIASSSPMDVLSVVGTTTLTSRVVHTGTQFCGTGGLYQYSLEGIEYCGSDNSDSGGVQILEDNGSNGTNAWGGYTLNNDLADNTFTHFGGLYLNSSGYTSTGFGTAFAHKNQLTLQDTDGPLYLMTGTTTDNSNTNLYIAFNTGSTNTGNERMRITSAGNVGIATTTPNTTLTVSGVGGAPASIGSSENGLFTLNAEGGNSSASLSMGVFGYSWIQSRFIGATSAAISLALNPGGGNVGIATSTPDATLQIKGSEAHNVTQTATTYTIATTTDFIVAITSTASTRTINLPQCTATSSVGTLTDEVQYVIKDESGGAATNNITVQAVGGQKIDGASTKVINTNYGDTRVYCDGQVNGGAWFTI